VSVPFNGKGIVDIRDPEKGWSHSLRVTGGTIKRVAIDVSGEPCIDMKLEVQGMLTRERGT
jgi:hypothetical protein